MSHRFLLVTRHQDQHQLGKEKLQLHLLCSGYWFFLLNSFHCDKEKLGLIVTVAIFFFFYRAFHFVAHRCTVGPDEARLSTL